MKRNRLSLPQEYISSLEEVLGVRLDDAFLRSRDGKKMIAGFAREVEKINKGLTSEREDFLVRRYLQDTDLRRAYELYYTSINVLKPFVPLDELFLNEILPQNLRVLDLGAGTGAASLGLIYFLHQKGFRGALQLHLIDAVEQNLEEAQRLIRQYAKQLSFDVSCTMSHQQIDPGFTITDQYDLVMIMNTLNELSEDLDTELLSALAPGLTEHASLLAIEPATREASRRTLRFRDKAVENGYTVFAPCTRQAGCPALKDENNWCHTEVHWERPSFIRAIDDIVGTLRLSLKYTYITLNQNGQTLSSRLSQTNLSRVVSELFSEKGRLRVYLCDESGRNEHIMNKRDRSPGNRPFEEIERYDLVKISEIEPREHDRKVTVASEVNSVLPRQGARY